MLKTPKGADRDELEKAVMLAVAQIAEVDRRTEAVLRGVDLKSDAQRVAFLPVLGRIGGRKALDVVQSALKSRNTEVYEAGVRAISNWPDASVADQLIELARGAREKRHRIWALRALIRVISLPGDKPDAQRLAALKQAMSMATREEERLLIVERAAAVRTIDTLRFVAPYLDQPTTAQQACRTVVELAHHEGLRKPNQKQFDPVLKKVIAISKDHGLVDRAKRYLSENHR
jgi:hypothetical protein